jgi:hypothetical protein
VLLAIAHQERRTTWGVVPVLAGALLLMIGPLLVVDDPMSRVSSLLVLVVICGLFGYQAILYRRMSHFLEEHGAI